MIWITFGLFFICFTLLTYVLSRVLRLQAESILKQAESDLDALYLEMKAKQILYVTIAASVFALIFGFIVTKILVFAILCGVAGYFLPKLYFRLQHNKRRDKLNSQIVGAIEMLANALKAGTNFIQAMEMITQEMVPPISQEFSLVIREIQLGLKPEEALNNLARRVGSEEFELVVTATNIARETGGNLGEVYDRISETVRSRHTVLGKIKSLTAEGKMQGLFVGALPFIMGGLFTLIDPESMAPMFTTPLGFILLGAVVFLCLIGNFLIRKVSTIDV